MKKLVLFAVMVFVMAAAPVAMASETTQDPAQLLVKGPEKAAALTYQTMETGRLLVSVTDADEEPLMGLTAADFSIRQGIKTAKILSVEPLATDKEVPLNIVMVVDNSQSMAHRKAIGPLKSALEAFYKTLRPIDNVSAVVFDDKHTQPIAGKALHVRSIEAGRVDQLRSFLEHNLDRGLTEGTYLHDAMLAAMDMARRMPQRSNKFLVVFSDGEDINSSVDENDVRRGAVGIPNLAVYAVDYMPSAAMDPFLQALPKEHNGRTWKAASAADLLPVFEAFSSTLLHRYIVSYRFLEAPTGHLAFAAPDLTIEEVTTIDSAPLLNHIYFDMGRSELSDRYMLFKSQAETAGFDEKQLKGAMEKYRHVLNIIGSRLKANPEAKVRLVGCNANIGKEKGRIDLSRSRAEAVRAYLRYVWGIDPKRFEVKARNLPEVASTNRIPDGQAENQRVEIYADNEAILDTVDSAYVQKVSNLNELRILPKIEAEAGLEEWQVELFCGGREIKTIKGQGGLPTDWSVPLEAALLEQISTCESVQMQVRATDKEANVLESREPVALPVHFVQRKEQMARIEGYRVLEQYALILFDYDSADIKDRNQVIMERIIARMNEVPEARATITGHTDTIGREEYNLALSDRRARAVHQSILAARPEFAERLEVKGVGPFDPLYDNGLPEGRSLNRTVTVTLEYMQR
ncbi:OmpA family protein [Desulfatitalea tepidiphila]|uniref:OmpA family protein n=1 Tax=Desulfatitalea tepidiphila TaxID=1185843 RepID=UPI0006B49BA7|nr:OmpA family protein [Desulfatitalea tepidiphila]